MQYFPPESDVGPFEYKSIISNVPRKHDMIRAQLEYRLAEGLGQCIYGLGINDDGSICGLETDALVESENVLISVCSAAGHTIRLIQTIGKDSRHVRIYQITNSNSTEFRAICTGQPDVGKSTLLGCINKCTYIDIDGSARHEVLRHQHEKATGISSSINISTVGFVTAYSDIDTIDPDTGSRVTSPLDNQLKLAVKMMTPETDNRITMADRYLTLIDTIGQAQGAPQTTRAYGYCPNAMLLFIDGPFKDPEPISASIYTAITLGLPIIVIATKYDIGYSISQLIICLQRLQEMRGKTIQYIRNMHEAYNHVALTNNVVPIFTISTRTGHGMALLTQFLALCRTASTVPVKQDKVIFRIIKSYRVTGRKDIFGGYLASGTIQKRNTLTLVVGKWRIPVRVIMTKDNTRNERPIIAGDTGTVEIVPIEPEWIEEPRLGKSVVYNIDLHGGYLVDDSVTQFKDIVEVILTVDCHLKQTFSLAPKSSIMFIGSNIRENVTVLRIEQISQFSTTHPSSGRFAIQPNIEYKLKVMFNNPHLIEPGHIFMVFNGHFIVGSALVINCI